MPCVISDVVFMQSIHIAYNKQLLRMKPVPLNLALLERRSCSIASSPAGKLAVGQVKNHYLHPLWIDLFQSFICKDTRSSDVHSRVHFPSLSLQTTRRCFRSSVSLLLRNSKTFPADRPWSNSKCAPPFSLIFGRLTKGDLAHSVGSFASLHWIQNEGGGY